MKVSQSTLVALLCTLGRALGQSAALPQDVVDGLEADGITDYRVVNVDNSTFIMTLPDNSVKCGDHEYTPKEQRTAVGYGIGHTIRGERVPAKRHGKNGPRRYPSNFRNEDDPPVDFHHCGVVHNVPEWPILPNKIFMKGDEQGKDRVVYKHYMHKQNVFIYCGAMYHPGNHGDNNFVRCKDVGGS